MLCNYWITEIDRYYDTLSSGRTKPALCGGMGSVYSLGSRLPISEDRRDDFIVKFCDGQMLLMGRLSEFVAALLAQILEIPSVIPAIISCAEGIADLFPEPRRTFISQGCGKQYGSQQLAGYTTFPSDGYIGDKMQSAFDVFAFDMLIGNPDRRVEKPNLLTRGSSFTVLDHEMAFPFLLPIIGPKPDPLMVGLETAPNHIFYSKLRGKKDVDVASFIDRLRQVDDDILNQICEVIPQEWHNGIDSIIDHIKLIRDNADRFAFEIKRTLL